MPGAANPQSWNRYAYTLNNPILYNDPSGHNPQPGGGVIALTLFGITLLIGGTVLVYQTPQMQEIGQDAVQYWTTTARDWKERSIDSQAKRNEDIIRDTNLENPQGGDELPPLGKCLFDEKCLLAVSTFITGLVILVADATTTGGCDEPEALSKCPKATNTPVPTPTNSPTPTMTPTNTPTPTMTPTNTPTPTPSQNMYERKFQMLENLMY